MSTRPIIHWYRPANVLDFPGLISQEKLFYGDENDLLHSGLRTRGERSPSNGLGRQVPLFGSQASYAIGFSAKTLERKYLNAPRPTGVHSVRFRKRTAAEIEGTESTAASCGRIGPPEGLQKSR